MTVAKYIKKHQDDYAAPKTLQHLLSNNQIKPHFQIIEVGLSVIAVEDQGSIYLILGHQLIGTHVSHLKELLKTVTKPSAKKALNLSNPEKSC